MNDMTKREALENHRKMWNWIADETLRQKRKVEKREYFRAMGIPISERPLSYCYCCAYVIDNNCDLCPIFWVNESNMKIKNHCTIPSTYYMKWFRTLNYEHAAEYARLIAELPEKEGGI